MVNNSNNMNKGNNNLLPQIIEHKKKNMSATFADRNPGSGMGYVQNRGWDKYISPELILFEPSNCIDRIFFPINSH